MKWTRETTRAFVLFFSCVLLAGSSSSVVRHADAYVVPGSFPVDYSLGDDLEGMSRVQVPEEETHLTTTMDRQGNKARGSNLFG